MTIQQKCPHCSALLCAPPDWAGRTVTCTNCRAKFALGSTTKPAMAHAGVSSAPALSQSSAGMQALQKIGRYEVRGQLGTGSFGIVFRAFDPVMNREVAIKMLRTDVVNSQAAVKQFEAEANVLAQLLHPNIVPVYDKGIFGNNCYLVSALLPGETLESRLEKMGPLEPKTAIPWLCAVLKALHYVHDKKLLHRDIKPANIMISEGGIYLMDFGLAVCYEQGAGTRRTQEGTVLGTPAYMSPEQARGEVLHLRPVSDLYAVGVLLFQMLTGRLPFESPWPKVLVDIMETPPPPPSCFRPGLDAGLDAICLKALSKIPEQRYKTGFEFAQALSSWLGHSQMSLPPTTDAPRASGPTLQSLTPSVVQSREDTLRSGPNHPSLTSSPSDERGPSIMWILLGGLGVLLLLIAILVTGIAIFFVLTQDTKPKGEKDKWKREGMRIVVHEEQWT